MLFVYLSKTKCYFFVISKDILVSDVWWLRAECAGLGGEVVAVVETPAAWKPMWKKTKN